MSSGNSFASSRMLPPPSPRRPRIAPFVMRAKSAFADCDSPSKRRIQRLRFAQSGKYLDVKDVKEALDVIIRPSLQLWKLGVGRSVLPGFKRPQKHVILGDNASSTSSITPKKKVRFDEQPVTISRRGFFERYRKDSSSSPARPCLVIRERDDVAVCHNPPEPPTETDCHSVYEDCLSDHPGFLSDLQVLDGDDRLHTRPLKSIRRSEFYEIESGIATFDRTGYANYCLSRWLEKQREEARAPKKLMFEDPALLPSRTLSPLPASNPPDVARPMLPLPAPISRPPRSLPLRIWKYIEDELQNAIAVLIIGLFIHICLLLFLLYDIITRGFIPSDD